MRGIGDRLSVCRIVAVYVLFVGLWMYLFGPILRRILHDREFNPFVAICIGFLFILITAAVLYKLISHHISRIAEAVRRESSAEQKQCVAEHKRTEEALRQELSFMDSVIDSFPGIFYIIDPLGRHIRSNRALKDRVGLTKERMNDFNVLSSVYEEDREYIAGKILEVFEKGKAEAETRILNKAGEVRDYYVTGVRVVINGGTYLVGSGIDITERKKAEEDLRSSEAQYRFLTEKMKDVVWILDTETMSIRYISPSIKGLRGFTPQEVMSVPVVNAMASESRDRLLGVLRSRLIDFLAGKFPPDEYYTFEMQQPCKDGSVVWVEAHTQFLLNEKTGHVEVHGVSRDISARKKAEEELQKSRDELEVRVRERTEQLISLAAELSLAEERERRRIATVLHDQVGQTLIFSKIKLNSLSHALSSESFGKLTAEIGEYISRSIEEIRSLTFQLSPPLLYEVGFEAAVEWLGEEFGEKFGLRVEFEDDGRNKPLNEEASVALFQMVRELLANAARHAKAKKVRISVEEVSGKIKISVTDDGTGFDRLNGIQSKNKRSGFGLFNICQRIEYLGGEFLIESKIGRGTRATLLLPFKNV